MKRFHTLVFLFIFAASFPCLIAGGTEEWPKVTGPRLWSFPQDHGAHPAYRTEWWYFTGNLLDGSKNQHGYELTFFRQGLRRKLPPSPNAWDIRDLYLAHFALTDVNGKGFHFLEKICRSGPGLAGSRRGGLEVWLQNWSARMEGKKILLDAHSREMEAHLELIPEKPPVIHGESGISKKGPAPGQASYYASITALKTRGVLRNAVSGASLSVQGKSWFDHEFGSNQLAPNQRGWDWFGLHLSDGQDLMIYLLRLADGSMDPASSGTLIRADGSARRLKLTEFSVAVLGQWKSLRSKGTYPSRWRIQIPSAGIDFNVTPLLEAQELNTKNSTGIIYWEGAAAGEGTAGGRKVSIEGYVELTGYAGGMGGIF